MALMGYQAQSQGCAEPTSDEGVVVFGFLQPQFDYVMAEEGNSSTFRFNRMRIGVMGNIPYDFGYYALLETSPFFNDDGQIFLIDAFVSYNRYEFARASVGRFKKPIGLELLTPCSGLHTIERSMVVNELTGPTNRDMGFTVMGGNRNSLVSYQVAIMNGGNSGWLNDNGFMDYYGRVDLRPIKGISIGGSFSYGESNPTIEDEGAENDQRFRYGTDIDYQWNKLRVQSEYLFGEDRGSYTTGGGCEGDAELHEGSIKRQGFYVMGMYDVTPQIQPVIKYEQYDEDRSISDNLRQVTTFGVNIFFNDWTRLQVNYLYKAEDPEEVKNDALLVQIQVKI